MSEIMRPLPFAKLMRCLDEYRSGKTIFGVSEIYRQSGAFDEIETPIGPAAGPHTQMAQNIVAAYAAGARVFEVKTVQTMDGAELSKCIPRPCILAENEGYNVEWSTELTVGDALGEYVRAWFAIKLLSRELSLGSPDGFKFNMSVGYDLAGIKSPKIDSFIEGMKDARNTDAWRECVSWTTRNLHRFNAVDADYVKSVSPKVSGEVTLSTLHGCPPDEIERIASYLIEEKKLNTAVKCNPTLLDREFVRRTLDGMGYSGVSFDESHFDKDLQFADAVGMFGRLLSLARENGVTFGVKLSNTMPVLIENGELSGSEMYMSGDGLYPLTTALAAKLCRAFDNALPVSYCGGADYFNIEEIYATGVFPVTMATTLLKPGGYNRLCRMAEKLARLPRAPLDWRKLEALSEKARNDVRRMRPVKPRKRVAAGDKARIIDCFTAPCKSACPISQDIPAYMALVEKGDYAGAIGVICEKNPLPNITGTICTRKCQQSCQRNFYDDSVRIRDGKLKAARFGMGEFIETLAPRRSLDVKIAVIGGGPAGMAAAYFTARAGAKVTLFERDAALGGVVRRVIPEFRISGEMIDGDCRLLEKLGVDIRLNSNITEMPVGFDRVIVAVGAEKHRKTDYPSVNAIDFLRDCKAGKARIDGDAVIVGGGNTAIDAARAAVRIAKSATVVYRRTTGQMPAEMEELQEAMAEGVKFMELVSPVKHENGVLTLEKMRLGERGADGRREPVKTGETVEIPAATVICAIGESVDRDVTAKFPDCPVIGDALRGPATVVEAIADARRAVDGILGTDNGNFTADAARPEYKRQGETACLNCEALCATCVDVCPNRANVAVEVDGKTQILHIDRLCNECGNCASFCPSGGKPYRDKLTAFETLDDFEASAQNCGFLPLLDGRFMMRIDGRAFNLALDDERIPPEIKRFVEQAMRVI